VESSNSNPPKEGLHNPSFGPTDSVVNLLLFKWDVVQRLFSTFAGGWPGAGLLLLRLLTGTTLIYSGLSEIREGSPPLCVALQAVGVAAGIALLVGFFTPVAGLLATFAKAWITIWRFSSHSGDPWMALIQAILAVVLAMIGPGAWSIDARRFGRKRIDLSDC